MENLILTISLGNRPYLKYTRKSMEKYAKKLNTDLIVITEWPTFINHKNPQENRFIKLEIIKHYCEQYERLIFFDDTVFITPSAINLFELVPESYMGAWIESDVMDSPNRIEIMKKAIDYYSRENFGRDLSIISDKLEQNQNDIKMVNSGVMVLSKNHSKLFDALNYKLKIITFADQAFISYMIYKDNVPVYDIKNINNFVGSQIDKDVNFLDKDVNIYHVTSGSKDRIKTFQALVDKFETK